MLSNSKEFKDKFVINEMQSRIEVNTEESLSAFQAKWVARHQDPRSIYTSHLPNNHLDKNNAEDEEFVEVPIVTSAAQNNFDTVLMSNIKNDSKYQQYNSNLALAAVFASRTVQREQALQLIAAHLEDPKAKTWRYLPLANDDRTNCHTQEQETRKSYYQFVQQGANIGVVHESRRPREIGFGHTVSAHIGHTSKYLQDSIMYQGFGLGVDQQYATELQATYPKIISDRMQQTFGLRNINRLKKLVGSVRLEQLADYLHKALLRAERQLIHHGTPERGIPHLIQILWIAENVITEAFIAELKVQNPAVSNQFADLLTRLNVLLEKFNAKDNFAIRRNQAYLELEHHSFDKFFDDTVKPLITHDIRTFAESGNKAKLAEHTAFLDELLAMAVSSAKKFKNDSECDKLFSDLLAKMQSVPKVYIDEANADSEVIDTANKVNESWARAVKGIKHIQECAPVNVMARFNKDNFDTAYFNQIFEDMQIAKTDLLPTAPNYVEFERFDKEVFKPYQSRYDLLKKAKNIPVEYKRKIQEITYYQNKELHKDSIEKFRNAVDTIINNILQVIHDSEGLKVFINAFNTEIHPRELVLKNDDDADAIKHKLEAWRDKFISKIRPKASPAAEVVRLTQPSSPVKTPSMGILIGQE